MNLVLHNSVALAWCFEDEQTPALMTLLKRVAEHGAFAPMSWPLEVLNGLLAADRLLRLHMERRVRIMKFLADLPVRLDMETVENAWGETTRLAGFYELSVYDAAYLELAKRRHLPMATVDADLRRAGEAAGVEVLGEA